ncbi:MAG: glycosyltransferase family 4 protein, partial [bacterium]
MPSSRVRVLNLFPELKKEGIECDVVRYPKKVADKISVIKKSRNYDVTFLQKKLLSMIDVILLRRFARKLVFDFDDAIYFRHDAEAVLESRTRASRFKSIVSRADLVIAGNRILADHAGRFSKSIVIIPSAVETRNVPVHDSRPGDKVMIGWVGGGVNLHHLQELSSVFQKLGAQYDIQVRVLSNKTIEIPSVDVLLIPWALDIQEREIARFDIGVMPLPSNKHSEGKCGYKALQYMAAAVPPVVSDVGVNRDIVEHGKSGLVVSSPDGFYDAMKMLIENAGMRKELGLNARQRVEQHFS